MTHDRAASGAVASRRRAQVGRGRAVGYARVSTEDQAETGAGLEVQRQALEAEASRRGWMVVKICVDTASGRSLAGREGLAEAIALVESGEADVLVVTKLDRLSRSLVDFAALMERSRSRGWGLVALDLGVDTSTPSGEMMASVLAVFAQFERRLIAQRTKEALAVRKAQGVKLGRPRAVPATTRRRIASSHRRGDSLATIAEALNRAGEPTSQGGRRWYASTVRDVLLRDEISGRGGGPGEPSAGSATGPPA